MKSTIDRNSREGILPNYLLAAFVSLLAPVSFAADLWYQAVDGDSERSWDTPAAWHDGGALPTSSDNVKLNNASIVVPNYLRITNGVTAAAASLTIGEQKMNDNRLVGVKVEEGGTLNMTASAKYNLIVGDYGHGALWLDGGTMTSSGWSVIAGHHSGGSYGEITVGSGSSFVPTSSDNTKAMIIGLGGIGKMTAWGNVGYSKMELRIGGNTTGWSTFYAAGSDVTVKDCQIGGIAYFGEDVGIYNVQNDMPGYGELILSNAALKVADSLPDNTSGQLRIGRYAGGYGILRGSGTVQGSTLSSNNVRIWMNEGKIVADGFGEEATLDLNTVVSIRNNSGSIPADTTNGWYAVNKGAALFPRTWFNTGSLTATIGSFSGDTTPGYVNSVGFSISGVHADNTYFRGGLFAEDRSDVHADSLPDNKGIVGIWKFGITTDLTGTTTRNYSSVNLDFRYDQSKVKTGEVLALYRWNGSAWTEVAEKNADSTYRIAVTGLEKPNSWDGIYDIGTFALVKKAGGLVIMFK